MAKLVDAPDLGSGVLRRVGSSPITRTIGQKRNSQNREFLFPVLRLDNADSGWSNEAPRQWRRVGCEKRVLSILLSESTMPAAVGQTKDGRSSYRLRRDKAALSI